MRPQLLCSRLHTLSLTLHNMLHTKQRTKEGEERNPDDDGGAGGEGGKGRVTLLVNVWLNHLPNSAGRPGAYVCVLRVCVLACGDYVMCVCACM